MIPHFFCWFDEYQKIFDAFVLTRYSRKKLHPCNIIYFPRWYIRKLTSTYETYRGLNFTITYRFHVTVDCSPLNSETCYWSPLSCFRCNSLIIHTFYSCLFGETFYLFLWNSFSIRKFRAVQNYRQKLCDGRESNPGQLLGRQLCSPLYHHRSVYISWFR